MSRLREEGFRKRWKFLNDFPAKMHGTTMTGGFFTLSISRDECRRPAGAPRGVSITGSILKKYSSYEILVIWCQ